MRAWVVLAFGSVLAVGCAGKSSSSGDDEPAGGGDNGGTGGAAGSSTGGAAGSSTGGSSTGGNATGGSAGTATGGGVTGGVGGDMDCNDERRSLRDFIKINKPCSVTADCAIQSVGCGVTEDGCTGAVYTNQSVDVAEFQARRQALMSCISEFEGTDGCAVCDRVPAPPSCSNGVCVGGSPCALEIAALWDFKSRSEACEVDEDCATEVVGCEVTEDDCTGAIYLASDYDREELTWLRNEYHACAGGCGGTCRRAISPPACVSGRCVIRPLR